jgi:hypothetical protein
MRSDVFLFILSGSLLFLVSVRAPASAQVIEGHLLEAGTGVPVQAASVSLLDTAMAELRQTITDKHGAFRLEAPGSGRFFVLAEALGYKRTLDGVLELGEGGRVSIDFFLRPEPLGMDSLTVEAERQEIVQHLELQGFYDREAEGFGHFISLEEIEKRNAREYYTLLRGLPNLRVVGGGVGGTELWARFMGDDCHPDIFVDGALVRLSHVNASLEEVLAIGDVVSVEWYDGPAGVPLQWGGTRLDDNCGVIVFWTRGG